MKQLNLKQSCQINFLWLLRSLSWVFIPLLTLLLLVHYGVGPLLFGHASALWDWGVFILSLPYCVYFDRRALKLALAGALSSKEVLLEFSSWNSYFILRLSSAGLCGVSFLLFMETPFYKTNILSAFLYLFLAHFIIQSWILMVFLNHQTPDKKMT